MRFLIRALAAFVLAAGVPASAEDLTIVSKRTQDGKPSDTTTSYLASDHVRMAEAQEKMKNLPPEVQKKMEAMMGGAAGSFDVQKTGTTRKIAGYTCENWTVTLGQLSKSEECLTGDLQLPAQSWDAYRDFAESMKGMMAAMGPMAKNMAQMQEKFKDMKGFPLATSTTVSVMGRSSSNTSEVTEIKRGPIPASAWQIPAGYTTVDRPMLKGLQSK